MIFSDRGGSLSHKIGYFITKAWRTDKAGTGWVSEIFPNQGAGESHTDWVISNIVVLQGSS